MKIPVLWIEDDATTDVKELYPSVFMDGKYDLTIALNVTEGLNKLLAKEFKAVIVDIRLDPGNDPQWIKIFQQAGLNEVKAKLGLCLLYSVLQPGHQKAEYHIDTIPDWIEANRFGVLTVESELREELEDGLGMPVYRQKVPGMRKTTLLKIIEEIIENQSKED